MATERELVVLLYRADWKQLSLTADMNAMFDFDLHLRKVNGHAPPPPDAADVMHGVLRGIHRLRGRLVIAPGGRCRVEPTETAEPADEPVLERLSWNALLYPVNLLSGYTLALRGLVAVAGRDAFEVVATPRPWRVNRGTPLDRIETVVDAETGILLRREDFFAGQTLELTELSRVRFGALDAADTVGSSDDGNSESDDEDSSGGLDGNPFDGPGWKAVKTAANAAGAVLGTAVRHVPHDRSAATGADASGGRAASVADAAMPADNPFGGGTPASADVVGDELPYALYRGGAAPFTGVLHRWTDMEALLDWLRSGANRRGWDGVGALVGAVGDRMRTQHQVWRVQAGGGGRYRIDYVLTPQKGKPPRAMACDGEQRWRVYENRVTVGPAGPADQEVAAMVEASWLLAWDLSEVMELTFGGRRAFAFRVALGEALPAFPAPVPVSDMRAVVDAELGIVLLTESRVNGRTAFRSEFRDVSASVSEDAFRLDVPPGVRVIHHGGSLLNEIDVPEPVRVAARSAGTAARAAGTGIAAAKGFLDSLRGTRPPRG